MVNEVSEAGSGNEEKSEQWTIRLGKHVIYNPSQFRDQSDLIQKTIISLLIIGLGIYLVTVNNVMINYLGWLIIGSMAFLYFLSVFETYLRGKIEKERLK
jgi:uncharacterized Tic20 family protein